MVLKGEKRDKKRNKKRRKREEKRTRTSRGVEKKGTPNDKLGAGSRWP